MVYFRINELLKKNKKSKYWFVKNMGGGYQALTHLMNNETKAIRFDTLERLCTLFNCEIGELIIFKKDSRKGDKNK